MNEHLPTTRLMLDTPIGTLEIEGDEQHLTRIDLPRPKTKGHPGSRGHSRSLGHPEVLTAAITQLEEYFEGDRTEFDLPLQLCGTQFQRDVWTTLARIPYGETVSYAELAEMVGRPGAFRAVGQANGSNPIPIVLPCHRVIASGGGLGGYGGGLDMKRRLLELEGVSLTD